MPKEKLRYFWVKITRKIFVVWYIYTIIHCDLKSFELGYMACTVSTLGTSRPKLIAYGTSGTRVGEVKKSHSGP